MRSPKKITFPLSCVSYTLYVLFCLFRLVRIDHGTCARTNGDLQFRKKLYKPPKSNGNLNFFIRFGEGGRETREGGRVDKGERERDRKAEGRKEGGATDDA